MKKKTNWQQLILPITSCLKLMTLRWQQMFRVRTYPRKLFWKTENFVKVLFRFRELVFGTPNPSKTYIKAPLLESLTNLSWKNEKKVRQNAFPFLFIGFEFQILPKTCIITSLLPGLLFGTTENFLKCYSVSGCWFLNGQIPPKTA